MDLQRTQPLLSPKLVASKKLLFLGAGSLGSLVVSNLAYPWRQVILVDHDTFKQENLERHLLGQSALGRPKVAAVADWLLDKGIETPIIVEVARAQEVLSRHRDADLALVCIDDQLTLLEIDEWCAENNIPALYGGIYPRGTGGEVIVIPDSNDVCYQCAAHLMERQIYQGQIVNYGLDKSEYAGSPTAVPMLHWTINATASDMAGLALDILAGKNVPPQVLVHTNNNWEPVLNIPSRQLRRSLAGYIANQTGLGLLPHWRLEKADSYQLSAKYSVFSLSLNRSEACSYHSSKGEQ